MKTEAEQILGKTIVGIIIKQNKQRRSPQSQLFLVFDDHTTYEFWSPDGGIRTTGGLWPNSSFKRVYDYMEDNLKIVYHAVKDPDSDNVASGSYER